ncbi:MAG: hypothetical protein OXL96_22570 [Candidatus Poribacteria bacterium]|nr:hypothetical protein [Candidatus Poribacteria bacterium]
MNSTANTFISPAVQAMNLIRYIGDKVSESGSPISNTIYKIQEAIEAPSDEFALQLIEDLKERGTIIHRVSPGAGGMLMEFNLSLDGWEKYEAEKRGQFAGNYGFIAMQFNDPDLEAFVQKVVKPTVKEGIGYDLVDMRDVPEAGIIDNIMRVRIRDAAFVIAELSHDNLGAYWEAGYAEGLGKPVIYICEKKKFDKKGTHFDTNHCTTVFWNRDNDEGFKKELIATIRRSLDLFEVDDSGTIASPMTAH